tara:strand:+ start:156 stop:1244 length:1089 start_codon:yes stop_codon:yes gene_type:complete
MNVGNGKVINGKLHFDFENVELPYVNGLRRTILADINIVGIKGFPHENCDINILENNSGLNNEIMKHRIMCIPVHVLKPNKPIWKTIKFVINVQNNTDKKIAVTSENISLINTETGKELSESMTRKIFPPDPITNDYVLLCYLDPIANKIKKSNQFYAEAVFSIVNPKNNSCYNCVSNANFSNTIDVEKQELGWLEFQKTLPHDSDMEKEKQNWKLLKGQHFYKENHFNFTIKSLGFYTNKEILIKALNSIVLRIDNISKLSGVKIVKSKKTVMSNSYDIILENYFYTIGNILKKTVYDNYYGKDVNYVGFVVEHPHDSFSVLRISYNMAVDNDYVSKTLKETCNISIKYIQQLIVLIDENL